MANRSPDFTTTLSFRLSQVGAHLAVRFAELLRPTGLSPREFAVLSAVRREGPRTQQQLADALGMHRNNLAELAEQMEAAGLVERREHPTDRRALHVHLAEQGRLRLDAAAHLAQDLDAEILDDFPAEDGETLGRLLEELAAALHLKTGVHPHLGVNRPARRTLAESLPEPSGG